MEHFHTKFEYKNHITGKNPFNGQYINALSRIPNVGEEVCFDGVNRHKVLNVITELKGWDDYYIIVIE